MTQQQTAVAEQTVQTGSTPPAAPTGPKKKKRRSKGKLIAGLIVLAAVIVAVAVVLWYFVFRENNEKGAALTDVVQIGSIQATVEGSGMTRARNSASVTPGTGTILELFVQEGDQVQEGQQLYRMDDTTAREAVTAAQKEVDNCTEELQKVYDKINQLTVTAPHSGNLREVAGLKVGDTVNEGDTIATIVNDTKLRLSLYYSYAYENDIKVGQTAQISIPAIMGSRTGTVEKINKVRFVSPEGATHFEVVFVLDNPGTLTEGMEASAALTAGDGTPIYAYEGGTLKFYESTVVKAKASGPLEQFDLMNYGDVKAGQVMARLGAENTDEEITSKEEALKAAQEKLKTANDELGKYNATAPISGTVLSCSLTEGAEVQSGQGITIADTTKMVVEISVDERNARYVKTGMMVNIDQYGTPYMGVVESVSMTASGENGVASVPAVVTVDNIDGSMIPGTYVTYSFVASESDNCLVVPIQAVKDVTFDNVTLPDTLDAAPAEDGMDGDGMTGGDMPVDGGMIVDGDMPVDGGMIVDGDMPVDDGMIVDGGVAVMPQSYGGGAFAQRLMAVAEPMPMPGGDMGGDMGGGDAGGSKEGKIVWVKSDEPPVNAILEPDPAWEGPEGFWAVPVETGLYDVTKVEITRGLSVGQEIFLGYENPNEMYY